MKKGSCNVHAEFWTPTFIHFVLSSNKRVSCFESILPVKMATSGDGSQGSSFNSIDEFKFGPKRTTSTCFGLVSSH